MYKFLFAMETLSDDALSSIAVYVNTHADLWNLTSSCKRLLALRKCSSFCYRIPSPVYVQVTDNGNAHRARFGHSLISTMPRASKDFVAFLSDDTVCAFRNVHSLDLGGCTRVTDVSALRNVKILKLRWTNVTDVSALGNVKILDLSDTRVTDVSALGNVEILDLSGTCVSEVSALHNVKILNLSFSNVTDVSALGNVKILCLHGTRVYDVSALQNVRICLKLNSTRDCEFLR